MDEFENTSAKIYTVSELTEIIAPIAKRFGLCGVYLFGSYAEGCAKPDSDVDLHIDSQFETLLEYQNVVDALEDALGKHADIITTAGLERRMARRSTRRFYENIKKYEIKIYEA